MRIRGVGMLYRNRELVRDSPQEERVDYAKAHVPVWKNHRGTGLRRGDGDGRLDIRRLWCSEGAEMREKAKTIEREKTRED